MAHRVPETARPRVRPRDEIGTLPRAPNHHRGLRPRDEAFWPRCDYLRSVGSQRDMSQQAGDPRSSAYPAYPGPTAQASRPPLTKRMRRGHWIAIDCAAGGFIAVCALVVGVHSAGQVNSRGVPARAAGARRGLLHRRTAPPRAGHRVRHAGHPRRDAFHLRHEHLRGDLPGRGLRALHGDGGEPAQDRRRRTRAHPRRHGVPRRRGHRGTVPRRTPAASSSRSGSPASSPG